MSHVGSWDYHLAVLSRIVYQSTMSNKSSGAGGFEAGPIFLVGDAIGHRTNQEHSPTAGSGIGTVEVEQKARPAVAASRSQKEEKRRLPSLELLCLPSRVMIVLDHLSHASETIIAHSNEHC